MFSRVVCAVWWVGLVAAGCRGQIGPVGEVTPDAGAPVAAVDAGQDTADASTPCHGPSGQFCTAVWDVTAEWEVDGPYASSGPMADLDGPRHDFMARRSPGVGVVGGIKSGGNEAVVPSYDVLLDRVHVVAGSAVGYLDGPFTRARFLGNDYVNRMHLGASADQRYVFTTEPRAANALRRLDFQEQQVTTLLPEVQNIRALWAGEKLYVLVAPWQVPSGELWVLDFEGSILEKHPITMASGLGIWGCSMVVDEARRRVYCGAQGDAVNAWYLWAWDLDDNSFHGLVPTPRAGQVLHETGPYEGQNWYQELHLSWGPQDPSRRFLWVSNTDRTAIWLVDLVDQKIRALSKEGDRIKWVADGAVPKGFTAHGAFGWQPDGSDGFFTPMDGGGPSTAYRRVK